MNKVNYTILNIINALRKITNDNTVRYIPTSERTKKRDTKPKADSLPRKQNKKIHKIPKNFIKNVVASGFGYLK